MNLGSTLGVALVLGLVGLAILTALWPTERSAHKLLAKWGIDDPAQDETDIAMQYLRRRRFWYPWLFLALPTPLAAIGFGDDNTLGVIGATLVLGGLLAELFAQRPAMQTRREATLEHRGVRDFAPMWTLIVTAVAEIAALTYVVVRADWPALAVAAGAAVASWLIMALAVRRPVQGTRRVDLALRHRSARVALGLGIGTVAAMCWQVNAFPEFVGFVVSIAAMIAIASPPRRLPAIAARAG
ncbi:hypothetical protein [Prauserella cavernicola]|uniref:Uncharacterized protein n=1 Tax=Prauserella cavernicola TaxID=2800127 RepID=A0A934QR13_9PSEU|nr:hypothetical protein [Prauserella cavernicola]MBK1783824.1 hypothetical protein [Prauserella cavernicola]